MSTVLDELLDTNQESYTTPHTQSLFSTHREISIARYALSQQAEAYHKAVSLLQNLLDSQQDFSANDPAAAARALTNIFQLVQSIENKSQKLIESSQRVTQLLGQAVSIDVDKVSLYVLVTGLPAMLRDVLLSITNDETLTSRVCTQLSSQLESTLSKLRFSPQVSQQTPIGITQDIVESQYLDMINSVPSQPTS